jgi:putative lipoprotein
VPIYDDAGAKPPATLLLLRVLILLALLLLALPSCARADDAWTGRDQKLHFGMSAAIALSSYAASGVWTDRPGYRFLAGSSLALAAGAGKELWDAAGHGDPSLKDISWDLVGTLTGAGLALGIDYLWQRVSPQHALGTELGVVRF